METGTEEGGWSRQTQGVRNHCVHWRSNLGRLPAWLREWVSDGVLETGQAEPFVPAAATFQSATDIYTPGLIERLACEPSACTHTPTPPSTHACTHTQRHTAQTHTQTHTHPHTDTLLSALPPQTQPALTHRSRRPDMLHLWRLTSREATNSKGDLWRKPFCQRLNSEFVSGSWYLLILMRFMWEDADKGSWSIAPGHTWPLWCVPFSSEVGRGSWKWRHSRVNNVLVQVGVAVIDRSDVVSHCYQYTIHGILGLGFWGSGWWGASDFPSKKYNSSWICLTGNMDISRKQTGELSSVFHLFIHRCNDNVSIR